MKVEVAVLGSISRTVLMVFVDVKQHLKLEQLCPRPQELCESRGGRPGFPVPNSPHSLCGRDATLNTETIVIRTVVDHSVQSGPSVLNPTWAAGTLTGQTGTAHRLKVEHTIQSQIPAMRLLQVMCRYYRKD